MFSTIMEKTTALFDRRVLLSAFFPSLVFWLLTVALVIIPLQGWDTTLKRWDSFSGTLQFLLLLAFFAWVTFWALLTTHFQILLVRLFEGYWPTRGPLAWLFLWRRNAWRKRWDKLDKADRALEASEQSLLQEQDAYAALPGKAQSASLLNTSSHSHLVTELEALFSRIQQYLDARHSLTHLVKDLCSLGEDLRAWWPRLGLTDKEPEPISPELEPYAKQLKTYRDRLVELIHQQLEELATQRLYLARDLLLYYPPERQDIMPMQLGNVLKAAELYPLRRYGLDAVLLWPRLEEVFPEKFRDAFRDLEAGLFSMITLCASLILFGAPLALWTVQTMHVASFFPWWVIFALGCVAWLCRCPFAALCALLALSLNIGSLYLTTGFWSLALERLQESLTLTTLITLLAWISYQNAVQIALSYGEKVKTAFDLYRWDLLTALHLKLPRDLEEEKKIWTELCLMLYREYTPDPRYLRFAQPEPKKPG